MKRKIIKRASLPILILFAIWYGFSYTGAVFSDPYSTVVYDRNGTLLGARTASDGQWRFEEDTAVPEKFATCLIHFEDKRFYSHPGVDAAAILRAANSNVSSSRRVSGASTLTMQLVRMSSDRPDRNWFQKIREMILATRLELRFSKKEILSLYASHAPFGGNVVGLNAASWRYYGKKPELLTWSEAATLAVLPNTPSMIHPGKNRKRLEEKRNRLLRMLVERKVIDSSTFSLALLEQLPAKPLSMPNLTPHVTENLRKESGTHQTSIEAELQQSSSELMTRHQKKLNGNGIFNAALIIADHESGEIISLHGNFPNTNIQHDPYVDMANANRSTGSVLKPLLYAAMLHDGQLLPNELVADIPVKINRYMPKNYNSTYEGVVPASRALSRSLNIPAVHMLQKYSPEKFCHFLKKTGISSIDKQPSHYGLSLILGGAEASLLELTSVYASMARTLTHYNKTGNYFQNDFRKLLLTPRDSSKISVTSSQEYVLDAASIYHTLMALKEVERPEEMQNWKFMEGSRTVAWKTGTSFGNRDAWAIGCSGKYTVGVWLGNANGEGRPGLTGIDAAAPLLFDAFNLLPKEGSGFFEMPQSEMEELELCSVSGHLAGEHCTDRKKQWIGNTGVAHKLCPYHLEFFLNEKRTHRVHGACYEVSNMSKQVYFVLPPQMELYYRKKHGTYKMLPEFSKECAVYSGNGNIELIYPSPKSQVRIPEGQNGLVFEANHRNPLAQVYWHLDHEYIATTQGQLHQLNLRPNPGKHVLTIIDDAGVMVNEEFEVL